MQTDICDLIKSPNTTNFLFYKVDENSKAGLTAKFFYSN